MTIIELKNEPYAPMRVRMVFKGDRYGLKDCLIWDGDEPLVEFYDARYVVVEGLGQFAGRYNLSVVMHIPYGKKLSLDFGIPAWTLSAKSVEEVQAWVYDVLFGS